VTKNMVIKNIFYIFFATSFLTGCGLVQSQQLANEAENQKIESIKSSPGMKALDYLVADDALTEHEGGKSLCERGCSMQNVMQIANAKPITIVALYIAIHDYGDNPPSTYNINDSVTRQRTIADIMTRVGYSLGSSLLADQNHISNLYDDFSKEHEVLGLKNLDEISFRNATGQLYAERRDSVNLIAKMREQELDSAKATEIARIKEYENNHPPVRVHLENVIPTGTELDTIRNALADMEYVTQDTGDNQTSIMVDGRGYNVSTGFIIGSIDYAITNCRKYASYAGDKDIYIRCVNNLADDIRVFNKVLKDKNISELAVNRALSEANIDGVLLFGHAARLARMYSDPALYQEATY